MKADDLIAMTFLLGILPISYRCNNIFDSLVET
jgi:hypothetical protein